MQKTFIDIVKLIEAPSPRSPWYVVESNTGKHYVSALGGRAARGLPKGATLKLYRNSTKDMSAYILMR
jgi:hypothetical protein